MLQSHTTARLQNVDTSGRCLNTRKSSEKRLCYAFVDVGDEDEGNKFIHDIKKVEIDEQYLFCQVELKGQAKNAECD